MNLFTEGMLRQYASTESLSRGLKYFQEGAVVSLRRRGNVLEAMVEGSEPEPYWVRIVTDAGGITSAECDCPYDWEGWCKHIVAALLACIRQPDSVEARPSLAALPFGTG
jgi:uncharacterized Zn finger protein